MNADMLLFFMSEYNS